MFNSFFPNPRLFFSSAVVWTLFAVLVWYFGGADFGDHFGMRRMAEDQEAPIGLRHFITPDFQWFYIYFISATGAFGLFWHLYDRGHFWRVWSIWGSIFILFTTYFSVQVDVAINNWRRPFFDTIQRALTTPGSVKPAELYDLIWIFLQIAMLATFVYIVSRFFVSHYVFRWRTAMNNFYMSHWPKLRKIEGASQRIQDDTMRFAKISEDLGVSIIESAMTLIAFLPVLYALSSFVSELPLVGHIVVPLFIASIFWSLFGTSLLAIVGIKLPGLSFLNQRVEASYRKELVYGEDDPTRAQPPTVRELFSNVRRNYFRLYFHYLYFNVVRSSYLQVDNVFAILILIPTIVAGKITYGIMEQILSAFGRVSNSFQFLINSWPIIVELMSIHKRLQAFEAAIYDQPLPDLDKDFVLASG